MDSLPRYRYFVRRFHRALRIVAASGRSFVAFCLIAAQLAWGLPAADALRSGIEKKVEAGLEEALTSEGKTPNRQPTQTRRDFLIGSARAGAALAIGAIGLGAQAPPPPTPLLPRSPQDASFFQGVSQEVSRRVIRASLLPAPQYRAVNDTAPDRIIAFWKRFGEEWVSLLEGSGPLVQEPERAEKIRKAHRLDLRKA